MEGNPWPPKLVLDDGFMTVGVKSKKQQEPEQIVP